MLAVPATAQVNWDTVFDGEIGQATCPPGKTHSPSLSFSIKTGTVKADRATAETTSPITRAHISSRFPGYLPGVGVRLDVVVYEDNDLKLTDRRNIVTADTNLSAFTRTYNGLKSNTRHAMNLVAGNVNNVLATICFKTGPGPADLSRPLAHYDDINHSDIAGGCYAFVDPSVPGNRAKVIACLCGARNGSQWARTDAEDGFKYIMTPEWRTAQGCTTN